MIRTEFLPWLFAGPSPSPSATLTDPTVTAAIIAVCGVILTVIATVLVQVSGRRATSRDTQKAFEEQREQLGTTLAAQREQLDRRHAAQREQLDRTLKEQRSRTLNERFATAAGQLGSDKPPAVRLAGVYAMAGLADDWKKNRQTCVDVLCAYLRLPTIRTQATTPTRPNGLRTGRTGKCATPSSGSSAPTCAPGRRCPGRA
jgi:hypothetical protein